MPTRATDTTAAGEPDALERKFGVMGYDSEGVNKTEDFDKVRLSPFEATNLCFFGTGCEEGNAIGIVIRMSDETSVGQIAKSLQQDAPETLMQIEIRHFIHIVSSIACFLGVSFFIIALIVEYKVIEAIVFMIGASATIPSSTIPHDCRCPTSIACS